MPAPTVALVMRSITMNAPVRWFSSYGSNAIAVASDRLHTPTSFSDSDLVAILSKLLTSILWRISVIDAAMVRVPILIRYTRPASIGTSLIHTMRAANWSDTSGRCSGRTNMSPREQSTSSSRVKVTALPGGALSRSPSIVTIRATVDRTPELATVMASPLRITPLATVPEKPRKSRLGRFTHCTGIRNGLSVSSSATTTVSRCSSRVGPVYQGVRSLRVVTLSP